MNWRAFETAATELAALGRELFVSRNVMILGSIRLDGSPRISAVNPFFVGDELLIGSMKSAKVADLRRDPRIALHSAIFDGDGTEGEFKLFGRAIDVSDPVLRNADPSAWWVGQPVEKAAVFAVDIESAVFVKWDWHGGTYETLSWAPASGLKRDTRSYP